MLFVRACTRTCCTLRTHAHSLTLTDRRRRLIPSAQSEEQLRGHSFSRPEANCHRFRGSGATIKCGEVAVRLDLHRVILNALHTVITLHGETASKATLYLFSPLDPYPHFLGLSVTRKTAGPHFLHSLYLSTTDLNLWLFKSPLFPLPREKAIFRSVFHLCHIT